MTEGFDMGIHFGQSIIKDMLRMREDWLTNREIGDGFGLKLRK